MKHFSCFFVALMLLVGTVRASVDVTLTPRDTAGLDSVRVSLLTCQPRQEIYALYGHTAIRIQDLRTGSDLVVNYGIFSFSKSWFALRFMFGLTDYEMSIDDFAAFAYHYASVGAGIRQQELYLTADEKIRLFKALDKNYLPENRVYRYNYFYDNCTTRARDIIESCLSGAVDYQPIEKPLSYRDEIHQYNEQHPWARMGKDLLLGVKADKHINWREQQFLPEYTMRDFERATVADTINGIRDVVVNTSWAVVPATQIVESEFPLRPSACAWIILALSLAITVVELLTKRSLWVFDAIVLSLCAACGLILFCMIFSQHPTVQLNYQILMLNPLLLVFGLKMIKSLRHRTSSWTVLSYMACLMLMLMLGSWQHYAEGVSIVAVALLLRYAVLQTYYVYKQQ